MEGYRDAQMVAAIQYDTTHLHAHVVVYEDYPKLARMRGKEEKGVIKESSFHQMAYDIDRSLTNSNKISVNENKLIPKRKDKKEKNQIEIKNIDENFNMWETYAQIIYDRMLEREVFLNELQTHVDDDEIDYDEILEELEEDDEKNH